MNASPAHPPRIGIDLLGVVFGMTGMAWQAWWLATLMPRLAPEMEFVLFLPPGMDPPGGPTAGGLVVAGAPGTPGVPGVDSGRPPANVEVVRVLPGRFPGTRLFAEQIGLAMAANRARLDILHNIIYGPPVFYAGVKLLTMHDLGFRVLPRTVPRRWGYYWNWAYGPAARSCRRIIAVSEWTRRDIITHLRRDPRSIRVISPGVDPVYAPSPPGHDPRKTLDRLGLPPHFILNVGTLQPRKDLETLLKTFARLAADDADLKLVICGGKGWGYRDPLKLPEAFGIEGRVHFTGFAPPEAMPDLYRGAELLLFTSRYEGFGLPLVEAMACGTPVVAAATSSVPEVVGDAALLAPAGDDEVLARAVQSVRADPVLRARMVQRGLERARLFSWERAARETLAVYREVLTES